MQEQNADEENVLYLPHVDARDGQMAVCDLRRGDRFILEYGSISERVHACLIQEQTGLFVRGIPRCWFGSLRICRIVSTIHRII